MNPETNKEKLPQSSDNHSLKLALLSTDFSLDINCCVFVLFQFWMCAIATTMPVPCGIFIPAFGLGTWFVWQLGNSSLATGSVS
jgi:hypothetical protein